VLRRNREVWYALIAIVSVTAVYFAAYFLAGALPAASSFVGHTIGVLGFVLMLMTETLYSIRKQMTDARWGNMAGWLRFHIVTGLVGPYMVLLHSSMKFQGLAGVALLLTAVVVASGLVGRYLYTRIPRETGAPDSSPSKLSGARNALATWHSIHVPLTWALFALAFVHTVAALYYATLQR
jgi:hypothetical protein